MLIRWLAVGCLLLPLASAVVAEPELAESTRSGMKRAAGYFRDHLARHGGYG